MFVSLAWPAAAQVRLSPEDCARVVAHVPEDNVTYRPGVDAMGRRVAPADLSPPQAIMPPVPWFVLSVDLAQRLMLPTGLKGDLPLGIVSVQGNQVLFNGQPIGDQSQAALAAACAQAGR